MILVSNKYMLTFSKLINIERNLLRYKIFIKIGIE